MLVISLVHKDWKTCSNDDNNSVLAEHQPALFPILKAVERLLQAVRSIERDGFSWPSPPAGAASTKAHAPAAAAATEQLHGTTDAAGSTVNTAAFASSKSKQQPDQNAEMSKTTDQAVVMATSGMEQLPRMTDVDGPSGAASADANHSRERALGTPVEARQGPGEGLPGGVAIPGNYKTGQGPATAAGGALEGRLGSGEAGVIASEKGMPSEEEREAYMRVIEGHAGGLLPGVLIAVAYPERIAQRQSRGNR